jgi:hypothetical protein
MLKDHVNTLENEVEDLKGELTVAKGRARTNNKHIEAVKILYKNRSAALESCAQNTEDRLGLIEASVKSHASHIFDSRYE